MATALAGSARQLDVRELPARGTHLANGLDDVWTTATAISFSAVMLAVAIHLTAGALRGSIDARPAWLSAASGMSMTYVFVHLVPELAEAQRAWLVARPTHPSWMTNQVYMMALLGVVFSLAIEQRASSGRHPLWGFRSRVAIFALYNFLIGSFALSLSRIDVLIVAGIAFGAHFLVNDHRLYVEDSRGYQRSARWILSGSVVGGWVVAKAWKPPVVIICALLGLLSGSIILNTIKEELPEHRQRRLVVFVVAALVFTVILLGLDYFQRRSEFG